MPNKEPKHFPTFYELNRQQAETFYVNVVENAIDSLETALQFFQRADTLKWKWIAISLHHALYTFAVVALQGSSYDWVLTTSQDEDDHHYYKRNERDKWKKSHRVFRKNSPAYTIAWEETDEDPTLLKHSKKSKRPQLIGFWTALARAQDSEFWMGRSVVSEALTLTESEWKSIEWITLDLRNGLIHFVPISRSVPVAKLKAACLDVLRAVEFLALQSKTIVYIHRKEAKERIQNAIDSLRKLLQ